MSSGQWAVVIRHVQRIFHGGTIAGLSEGQLLDRFLETRDEAAFTALVARHGPMVLGVCRGLLHDAHDVEDAFQATFLILVKKARGLRDKDRLGPWLYGVARRVAFRARADASRRLAKERGDDPILESTDVTLEAEGRELQSLIREEVDRLSQFDRMAVVLCYLEGLTHEEAADRLGWPIGTVKGRLSRARDKLKERLTRRGVTLPSVFVADLGRGLPTLVPPALLQSTTLAATRLATGQTLAAGIISAQSLRLMEGVIGTMFTTPLKIVATALASACLIAVPGVMAYQSATRPARPELPAPVVPEQTVIKTETSKPFEVPRPTNPALASRKSAEIAILALEALDVSRSEGNAIDPALESEWSRRLFAAISAPVFPPAEREVLLQLHLRRRERLHDQFLKAREKGGSRLGDLEEAFQLNETYRMLLRAETPPRLAENPFPAGGGGALGGASLPRILIDNPADQKQNEAIRAKLEERMTMNFPTDTTLEDLKRYLQQQTVDEKLGLPKGIPVYFDPQGLQDADKTMASTIAIELEGIPLRTILKLVLRQVGLTYSIEGGLLLITNEETEEALPLPKEGMGGGFR